MPKYQGIAPMLHIYNENHTPYFRERAVKYNQRGVSGFLDKPVNAIEEFGRGRVVAAYNMATHAVIVAYVYDKIIFVGLFFTLDDSRKLLRVRRPESKTGYVTSESDDHTSPVMYLGGIFPYLSMIRCDKEDGLRTEATALLRVVAVVAGNSSWSWAYHGRQLRLETRSPPNVSDGPS